MSLSVFMVGWSLSLSSGRSNPSSSRFAPTNASNAVRIFSRWLLVHSLPSPREHWYRVYYRVRRRRRRRLRRRRYTVRVSKVKGEVDVRCPR
jgi:hypothetical protein